jgi:uncharacterized protein YjiS (DUF1127 family)
VPPGPVLLEIGTVDLLKETYRVWAMHREFRTVLKELASYSDRELIELGLSRGDLARVAYEEAERRIGSPQRAADVPREWHRPVPAA